MISNQQVVRALSVLTLLAICAHEIIAQDAQPQALTPSQVPSAIQVQQASKTTPVPDERLNELAEQVPKNRELVSVQNNNNQSKVDVHVPLIFDMTNDKDVGAGHSKLDLSVLSGMVTVNRDKKRQPDGTISGPVTVTVFGIPVYTGKAVRSSEASGDKIAQELQASRKQAADTLATNTAEVYAAVRKANENAMKPLADMLRRMSALISQQSTAATNMNGRPAEAKDNFVAPSQFTATDFEPKTPKILMKKDAPAHESQIYA